MTLMLSGWNVVGLRSVLYPNSKQLSVRDTATVSQKWDGVVWAGFCPLAVDVTDRHFD